MVAQIHAAAQRQRDGAFLTIRLRFHVIQPPRIRPAGERARRQQVDGLVLRLLIFRQPRDR